MTARISLGNAKLKVIGLNPQRVTDEREARVVSRPTFSGMSHQKTGPGDTIISLEVLTVPLVFGGLDALEWLKVHLARQDTVNYWRMHANFRGQRVGAFCLTAVSSEEEHIHPFTGVGRKITALVEFVKVGSDG